MSGKKSLRFKLLVFLYMLFLKEVEAVHAPHGFTVFHVKTDNLKGNATQTHLKVTVNNLRQVGHSQMNIKHLHCIDICWTV